ncbi:MAG: ribosomal protein S18-alanine N-acetyltransferase [Terriglobales bacterium]|jgi:ribosomal-protein-alanine N-acetyltransferase
MPISIRQAAADDIQAILVIEQDARLAAHWSADQYENRISDGVLIVAEVAEKVCGFLCARVVAGEWEIENVVVGNAFRRHSIGETLMQALIDKCNNEAGTAILLEVRESNAPARALYEKCGLREVGRRRAYYRDPGEDAILYARRREG